MGTTSCVPEGRATSKRASVHFSCHKKQGKLCNIPLSIYFLMANQYEDEANDYGDESDIDETDGESLARRY
jgi:hypothetical protein